LLTTIQTILAILPGVLICSWIIYRDRHNREPIFLLLVCFLAGIGSSYPAIFMEEFWFNRGIQESDDILETFTLAFGVVAFSEELVKFVCVMLFAYPWKAFDEPLDGIVYSVMVSMGFATIENIIYAGIFGTETTILRAFTAVPAHAAFAVFMGYHIGIAKFSKPKEKFWHIFVGFAGAVIIHGAYDFFLLQRNIPQLTILAMIILAICYFYTFKLVKNQVANSEWRALNNQNTMEIPSVKDTPTSFEKKTDPINPQSNPNKWDDLLD